MTRGRPHQPNCTAVICSVSSIGLPSARVRKDPMEVSPLSRAMLLPCGSIAIPLITKGPSLFPSSPTRYPIGSPCGSLSLAGGHRAYHVPQTDLNGLGLAYSPVAQRSVRGEGKTPLPGHTPFGPSQLILRWFSLFGLLRVTTFTSDSQCVDPPIRP